jgi:hypothetical protein
LYTKKRFFQFCLGVCGVLVRNEPGDPATQPFFLKNSWSKEGQERIRCVKAQGKKKGSGQCTLTLTQQEKGTASFVETIHSKKRTPVFPKGNNSPSTVTSTEFLQITRFHYHIVDQSMFFIVRVAIAGGYGCHWLCRRLVVPSNQLLVLSRGIVDRPAVEEAPAYHATEPTGFCAW